MRRFNLHYILRFYDIGGWLYDYPVTSNFLSRTMRQNGSTVLLGLLLTYP